LALEQAISVNFLVEYLVAVLGLGVSVDYSLLLVTRWREERDAGRANEEAILAAGPTAGRAVVLSGTIVAVGLLSLVLLPVPPLRMNTGQPRANALGGTGQPAQTLHALERTGVPSAVVFPIQVLTHGGPAAARRAITIAGNTPGVYTVLAPTTSSFRPGQDSLISVIPTAEGNTSAGTATVTRLRTALTGAPGRVEVGGNTAQNVDFNSAVYGNFPLMLAAIALVTFLLLARAFRSIVLA